MYDLKIEAIHVDKAWSCMCIMLRKMAAPWPINAYTGLYYFILCYICPMAGQLGSVVYLLSIPDCMV